MISLNSCSIVIYEKKYGSRNKTLLLTSELEIKVTFCNMLV